MKDRGLLEHLRANWQIYAFLFYMVVSWATFSSRLTYAETNIIELQNSDRGNQVLLAQLNTKLSNIDVNIAQIQTSIEWLKKEK